MASDLIDRIAHQQTLLDAWNETRRSSERSRAAREEIAEFERKAARRIARLSGQLRAGNWQPSPVRPVTVPKPGGGRRTLGIPPLEDRIVERAVLRVLDPIVDPELLPWSFAYRRGLGVRDAIAVLIEARDDGTVQVVRADFERCFDSISRDRVLEQLSTMLDDAGLVSLVERLVHRDVEGVTVQPTIGLHQGSPLSPLLANVFLDGFDRTLLHRGLQAIRYADDFAVPVPSGMRATNVVTTVRECALAHGLELNASKLVVGSFDEGVRFLGAVVTASVRARDQRIDRPTVSTVYVTTPGSLLRSRGGRLVVERPDDDRFSLSFKRLRQVVVMGRVGLTTPCLQQLLDRSIDLVLLSDTGRYFGRLQGDIGTNPFVRDAQYHCARAKERSLELARRIVAGKIANMRGLLLRHARRRDTSMLETVSRLQALRRRVGSVEKANALMGVEGAASREYFVGFAGLLPDGFEFHGRRRRPPPDPVNSMLSFGYALLIHDVIAAVNQSGLDPYAGFLHRPRVGRPSLALDLVEELRAPIVDSVVLRAVGTGMIRPEHFRIEVGSPDACFLTDEGRRTLIAAYERRMLTLHTHSQSGRRVSYRVGAALQAKALAGELMGGPTRYEPLVWK